MYYYYKRYIVIPDCRTYPPTHLFNHLISGTPLIKCTDILGYTDINLGQHYKFGLN